MSEQLTNRRNFLATATATGLAATLAGKHVAFASTGHQHGGMSKSKMQECIDNCRTCEATCVATIQYCLKAGGSHINGDHLSKLQDCATMCRTSAELMLRDSSLVDQVCGVCSQACADCADSCATMSSDSTMAECEAACRACADTCASMAR